MIKRLRRRFIFAAMLAMSLVLFVIIAATNIMNYISVVRESDRLLSDVISPDRTASDVPVESSEGGFITGEKIRGAYRQ